MATQPPMDKTHLRVFQNYVGEQCSVVMNGAHLVNHHMQNPSAEGVFAGLSVLLTGAANVSKTLWGSKPEIESRRKPLRESLGIPDTLDVSVLRNKKMRNNIEHFDERIETWQLKTAHGNFADRIVAPGGFSVISGLDTGDQFRGFDTATFEVQFWDERYAIQPIIDAADKLLAVARSASMGL